MFKLLSELRSPAFEATTGAHSSSRESRPFSPGFACTLARLRGALLGARDGPRATPLHSHWRKVTFTSLPTVSFAAFFAHAAHLLTAITCLEAAEGHGNCGVHSEYMRTCCILLSPPSSKGCEHLSPLLWTPLTSDGFASAGEEARKDSGDVHNTGRLCRGRSLVIPVRTWNRVAMLRTNSVSAASLPSYAVGGRA